MWLKQREKSVNMVLYHLDGIFNTCPTEVPLSRLKVVDGSSKEVWRRARRPEPDDLPLRAQRLVATISHLVAIKDAP